MVRMLFLVTSVLTAFLGLPSVTLAETPWPVLDAPPRGKVEVVAEDLRLDGVPTQIRRFQTSVGPEEVLAFYRTLWRSGKAEKAVESSAGDWQVIARKHGEYWLSVQVKALGGAPGAEGYLAAALAFPAATRAEAEPPLPLPPQSQVLRELVSRDPGKISRMTVATNALSIDANVNWIEERLRREGFRRDTHVKLPDRGSGYAAVFAHGADEIVLTIERRAEGTAIVMNRITKVLEKQP